MAGDNRSLNSFNNSAGIIDLSIKCPGAPADQLKTARCQNRMKERILQSGRRPKPDRRGYANRRDCRLEFVDFPRQSSWAEPPETESRMGLSIITDRVARTEDHAGQFWISGRFCTDQKKGCPSTVFFQQCKNLPRCAWIRSVVDGQPRCFRGCGKFGQDWSEPLKRWDHRNRHQQQMRGEQNA